MKRIFLIALVAIIPTLAGCQGFIIDQVLDSATENAIKMMEAQEKINAEKRAQSFTLEGTFKSLEMKEKVVNVEDPSLIKATKKGNEAKVEIPTKTIKTCVITFSDGREMEFRNIPSKGMVAGKKYLIKYNGLNEITDVQELKTE